jgi:hypothetical protein
LGQPDLSHITQRIGVLPEFGAGCYPARMLFSSLLPGTIFALDFVWEFDVTQITGECEVHKKQEVRGF